MKFCENAPLMDTCKILHNNQYYLLGIMVIPSKIKLFRHNILLSIYCSLLSMMITQCHLQCMMITHCPLLSLMIIHLIFYQWWSFTSFTIHDDYTLSFTIHDNHSSHLLSMMITHCHLLSMMIIHCHLISILIIHCHLLSMLIMLLWSFAAVDYWLHVSLN